jgi:NDP-sugar pyrophosphorylase family protein
MGGAETGVPSAALVLAGGLGTRLAPVIGGRQKVLAEVGGRPFLAWILERLAAGGVREVVLCTGHGAEAVREAFGDECAGLRLLHSVEPAARGTAGALRLGLSRLSTTAATVLALNGDSLCDVDLNALAVWHAARAAAATIALAEVADATRYGRVDLGADGSVRSFHEKSNGAGQRAWVNAGVYVLSRAFLDAVPPDRAVSLEREVLPAWVGRGLYGYRSPVMFHDIGTRASYDAAAATLREGRLTTNPS